MRDPLISAIIPTFNGATRGFLTQAIESVLSQSYRNFELLIVDDGSTDDTMSLCKTYLAEGRTTYLRQRNRGPAAARNTGIEAAKGRFVCFLDDDDVWRPGKLEKQIIFMQASVERDPKTGMVYHAAEIIDGEGRAIGMRYAPASGEVYARLFFDCFIGLPSAAMVRKETLDHVGYFEEGKPYGVEDYDLWLRIARSFHIHSAPDVLAGYRVHTSGNLSSKRRMHEVGVVGVLARAFETEEPVPQAKVYGHWYRNLTMWHFREGDYYNCRRCYTIAAFYDHVGLRFRLAFWAAHFPQCVRFLERRFPRFVDRFRHSRTAL
jgi:glycosyltransferase involved in cell wall biosynthesis